MGKFQKTHQNHANKQLIPGSYNNIQEGKRSKDLSRINNLSFVVHHHQSEALRHHSQRKEVSPFKINKLRQKKLFKTDFPHEQVNTRTQNQNAINFGSRLQLLYKSYSIRNKIALARTKTPCLNNFQDRKYCQSSSKPIKTQIANYAHISQIENKINIGQAENNAKRIQVKNNSDSPANPENRTYLIVNNRHNRGERRLHPVSRRIAIQSTVTQDLLKISEVSEQDIANRMIVRKRSEIKSLSNVCAQAIFVLFLCDQINQYSSRKLRMLMGPCECKEMMKKMKIRTLCELGSVLLNYVIEHKGRLKINKQMIQSQYCVDSRFMGAEINKKSRNKTRFRSYARCTNDQHYQQQESDSQIRISILTKSFSEQIFEGINQNKDVIQSQISVQMQTDSRIQSRQLKQFA